jgi:hypothetical protein
MDDIFEDVAKEIFQEYTKKALEIAKQETPVDEGDLQETAYLDQISDTEADIVWGEVQGANKFVDYQRFVKVKGTGGKVLNEYWEKTAKRIEIEL